MTRIAWTAAALAGLLAGAPALASPCADQIAALDKRMRGEATEAISASTSGKETAARREGEGTTGTAGAADPRTAPPDKSAQAGLGADRAQQAKVALDEARTADGKGDAKGCEAATARAKQQLDAAP
jgi:hypothetical protein